MNDIRYKNIKAENVALTAKGSFIVKVSSDSLDLQNEIVNQKGITAVYPIPNLLEHDSDLVIGKITGGEVKQFEKSYSYYTNGHLFLNDKSATVPYSMVNEIYEDMKNGIGQFSIGYNVLESHKETRDNKEITVLDKILLKEISYTMNPANTDSGIVSIKNSNDKIKNAIKKYNDFIENRKILKEINANIEEINKAEKHSDIIRCTKSILSLSSVGTNKNIIANSRQTVSKLISTIRGFEKRYSKQKEEHISDNAETSSKQDAEKLLIETFGLE